MNKKFAAVLILLIALLLSACSAFTRDTNRQAASYFSEEYQVKNYADGKISTFGLNIAPAGEMDDWVVHWLADISDGAGFQYYVYSDPDSWDAYLYYPAVQTKMPLLTNAAVAVDFSDGVLKVYVTDDIEENALTEDSQDWIFHFTAHPHGVWPGSVELYWNGAEIECDAMKFGD